MTLAHRPHVNSLTDYITLGRSGLRVSPLCLGTMTFGEEVNWGSDARASEAVLASYLERGGNFIDTANVYTDGHSERIIGAYLASGGRRERAVIATKFFGNLYHGDPNGGGAGRKGLMHACHESLRRLQTDYIDLYWMHFWDLHTPSEETLRALDDLVRAGKVRYIGFSNTPPWKIAQAQMLAMLRNWTPLVAVQIEYSLIERSHEPDMLPLTAEFGLSITAWSPLKSGLLSGKHTRESAAKANPERGGFLAGALTERNFAIVDAVVDVARDTGSTPAKVALAWLLARPGIVLPIVGARTVEQLEQNLGAVELSLTNTQLARLDQVSAPPPSFMQFAQQIAPLIMHGGLSVNGLDAPMFGLGPKPKESKSKP